MNMAVEHTKAKFWKCALQVNPASYITYRGQNQDFSEDDYNQKLLEVCLEESIKVVGIADHGNVDSIAKIKQTFNAQGIVVFPGFEIASSEKIHLVCLYPEDTSIQTLNNYLYEFDIDTSNGTAPSTKSADFILSTVIDKGGFVYAAHCTDDSGVLKQKLNNIWKNKNLLAAQIPTSLEALKEQGDQANYQILLNKNPDYKRDKNIAIINAKDIEDPETLRKENATCLVKMSTPCFSSFKLAFSDSESRVRLNSDIKEKYYSRIESVRFVGGFLDGIDIKYSEHLNALIGGRGTGKSTLIESIRYILDIEPISKETRAQHLKVIKQNIGSGFAELTIKSAVKHGKLYTISRRYGESPIVKDDNGSVSTFSPQDLLPDIEIFGQNEIHEIAKDSSEQLKVVERFLNTDKIERESGISKIKESLELTRNKITDLTSSVSSLESDVEDLKTHEEDEKRYKELGIDQQLKLLPIVESERSTFSTVSEKIETLKAALKEFSESIPCSDFITDELINKYPDKEIFKKAKAALVEFKFNIEASITKMELDSESTQQKIKLLDNELQESIDKQEESITREFKKLAPVEGLTGKQIGEEYRDLIKNIERLKPKRAELETERTKLEKEIANRQLLLAKLSEKKTNRATAFEKGVKKLNRRLKGNIRVNYSAEKNRLGLIKLIVGYRLPDVGEGRLSWMKSVDEFSAPLLAETIRKGRDALVEKNWGMTSTTADRLSKISNQQVMEIEEFKIDDLVSIDLNVSTDEDPQYKNLDSLSTGQQCTALLHMLLLDNKDPLLLDQPEDNLDNAFIAERIVTQVRDAKLTRQFIFATHNANIPVFGDAEWIGVLESTNENATLPIQNQGSIDQKNIQNLAAKILEGGEDAFNRRKEKYGFE
ncbi:TrlF family AAA-like ATPase [Marinobacterium sp. MBR-109]|uniref:TrlF family AAA-like ATPase n=2 Tax=unclassified Marinobacterium TaxID=2644139 RepID=UPI00339B3CBA